MYAPLSSQRQQSLNRLKQTRDEILAETSGADTRADLAAHREAVFAGVRGNNAGPITIPYTPEEKAIMERFDAQAQADPRNAFKTKLAKEQAQKDIAFRRKWNMGPGSSQDAQSYAAITDPSRGMPGFLDATDPAAASRLIQMKSRAAQAYQSRLPMTLRTRG